MALDPEQITAKNFKEFYERILPYLNGAGGNDYSTDEKVIGSWIDGKPLYQKTFTGLNIPTGWDNSNAVITPLTHDLQSDFPGVDMSKVISVKLEVYNDDQGHYITHSAPATVSFFGGSSTYYGFVFVSYGFSANAHITAATLQYFK